MKNNLKLIGDEETSKNLDDFFYGQHLSCIIEGEDGVQQEMKIISISKPNSQQPKSSRELFDHLHKSKGSARTLYFLSKVTKFLDEICETYHLKASNIVNSILEDYIERTDL